MNCQKCGKPRSADHAHHPNFARSHEFVAPPEISLLVLIGKVRAWTDAGDTQYVLEGKDLVVLLDAEEWLAEQIVPS